MPGKSLQTRNSRVTARNSRGSFMIFVAILGVFVLLPLGLLGFELNRISMAQTQLRTATDSAVLAAAQAYKHAVASGNAMETAQAAGAKFFKMNAMVGGDLSTAQTGTGSNPRPKESFVNISYDSASNVMTAEASAGMEFAFGGMFGAGVPIVAYSKANVNQQEQSDIVIVLDRTGSMAQNNALTRAKPVICNFVTELTKGDSTHFGLVCYNSKVTSTVDLSKNAVNADEVKNMINAQTPESTTGTAGGMVSAYDMLCGPGHRPTASRLFVLVTDGLPNVALNGSSSIPQAKADCNQQGTRIGQTSIPPPSNPNNPPNPNQDTSGIRLAAIGFFHTDPATLAEGTNVLNDIANHVKSGGGEHGAEADVYTASNIQELQDALNKIMAKEIALIN